MVAYQHIFKWVRLLYSPSKPPTSSKLACQSMRPGNHDTGSRRIQRRLWDNNRPYTAAWAMTSFRLESSIEYQLRKLAAFHLSLQDRASFSPPFERVPLRAVATMCQACGLKLALLSSVLCVRQIAWKVSMRHSISSTVQDATREWSLRLSVVVLTIVVLSDDDFWGIAHTECRGSASRHQMLA